MRSGFLGGGVGPTAIKRRSGLAAPVPVAGAERVINGNFSSSSGWNVGAGWSIASGVLTGAAATSDVYQFGVGIRHMWGVVVLSVVSVASGGVSISVQGIAPPLPSLLASGTLFGTGRLITADQTLYIVDSGGSFSGVVDDVSVKLLNTNSLFSTRAYVSADCDLSVAVTRMAGTQAGLCARLDSATSPANFVIAYLDGTSNVKVDKCVAGVYTNLITGAVTYAAGRVLRLVCSGNNVSVYYNGVQVGTTQTVSDAGIVSNTRHGLFSTYAANTFTGYTAA